LAATLLASKGKDVVLFDEKLAWEKPCGGGVTHKTLQRYPFLSDASSESNAVTNCELSSPSGNKVCIRLQHPVAIFSRFALNGLLLDRAANAGATIRKERITHIERVADHWELRTPHNKFQASYIILAAGARNSLRSQFLPPISASDLMVTAGYFIPVRTSLMQLQFLKGITGYIWVFPRPDHVSAGIAAKMGETTTADLRRTLENWLEKNGFASDGASFYSHILPSLRPQTFEKLEVAGKGWAMIGDSAGLVDPVTGEGLYYALRSAELCAEALLCGRPEDYAESLKPEVIAELKLAGRASERFYHGQIFGDSVLEQMVSLTAKSASFRELMSDLFAGTQAYSDLRARLYRMLPTVMAQGLAGTLRNWSVDPQLSS
jgi:flavin-dependent dehydrogenase